MQNREDFEFIIGEDKGQQRIDKVLSSHPLIGSRSQAAVLIQKGLVVLNNKPVKASHITSVGEKFLISLPEKQDVNKLEPFDFKLNIVFEDECLLVVNKPAGIVVHPALGHSNKTLVNALIHHTKDLSMGFGENRPGIVHRLDKETSGLLVVAKNNLAHERLALQFKSRQIHRIYWALAQGTLKTDSGQISTLIGRHPKNRKKFSAKVTSGKAAITHFKKIHVSKGVSLIELKLETGRTHQIRVHLSESGHPILGDLLYGSDKKYSNLNRIALHAKELGFNHPTTGKKMFFNSMIPNDLAILFQQMSLHEYLTK